jgi:hypothetical protein
VNSGLTEVAITDMTIIALIAHWPICGVKVYVELPVVPVLIIEGYQVPDIPFTELPGKLLSEAPWQIVVAKLNTALIKGSTTVRGNIIIVPHCPGLGVNVYINVPIFAVFTTGDQTPIIPLFDVVGSP